MFYKDFIAQAAIAALPAVINAYKDKGMDVSWPTWDKEKADEWQMPDAVARACCLYAERLAEEMKAMGDTPETVFFDPDKGQATNGIERELSGITAAIEELKEEIAEA